MFFENPKFIWMKFLFYFSNSVQVFPFWDTIGTEGLHPTKEHLIAIEMPGPSNVSKLRSFVGSISYYDRFIKDM